MNRDAILATLIGFGLGLLITGAFLLGPNLTKSFKFPSFNFHLSLPNWSLPKSPINTVSPTSLPTPTQSGVTIDSPQPDAIVGKIDLLVSGSTLPHARVVVGGPQDEDVVESSDEGTYAGKVTLVEGKNDIIVTGYDTKGTPTNATITVFYTPEEF